MRECFGERFFYNGTMYDCRDFQTAMVFEGESVYEVIRVIRGIPLFLEDHLQRLHHTLEIQGKNTGIRDREIAEAVRQVIRENRLTEGNIKIIFNFHPGAPGDIRFLVYRIEHHYPTREQYARGVSCILYHAERPRPTAKIIHHSLRLTLYNKLIETGRYEALLVNRQGLITEGSRSNVFFIRGNTLLTAPDHLVLPGISRKYVLGICRDLGLTLQKEALPEKQLAGVDAAFLTGTSINILPVSYIEEQSFSPAHPLLQTLMQEYDKIIRKHIGNVDR